MIEKLNEKDLRSLDFMQEITNQKIADKINEIIDKINKMEE